MKATMRIFLMFLNVALLRGWLCSVCGAQDWPNWRGPHCNGSAASCGVPLVESLADARLVWQSDEEIPPGDDSVGIWFTGGYGSPIICDGKAIVQYFLPSGDVVDEKLAASRGIRTLTEKHPGWGRLRPLVDADDIIHAFDLRTGKTVWKTVFKGEGVNHNGSSQKGGGHWIPCAGEGKVFAIGTMGKYYCLDAKTGEKLWDGDTGQHYKWMLERKKKALATRTHMQGSSGRDGYANSCPIYADGVVAFPQGDVDETKKINQGRAERDINGLAGVEAATGKVLWRRIGCMNNGSSPLRWTNEGKSYFLAVSRGVTCIEPRTGKVLWHAGGIDGGGGYAGNTAAVSGNYLVGAGVNEKVAPEGGGRKVAKGDCFACLKIGPSGATKIWGLDIEQYGGIGYNSPAIHGDYAYATLGDKTGKCLVKVELATGKAERLDVGKQTSSTSLVMTDGRMLMLQGPGPEWMVDVSGSEMRELGSAELEGISRGLTPAVVDGLVILRNHTRLVCYNLKK